MNTIGIDPGLNGACAILRDDESIIEVFDIPTHGEGTQRRVDAAAFARKLRPHIPCLPGELRAARETETDRASAVVEMVGAGPSDGSGSAFRFGRATGAAEAVLGALGVPMTLVAPATWKRSHGLIAKRKGMDRSTSRRVAKAASRAKAIMLYPGSDDFPLVKHSDRAEAVLIALHGMRCASAASDEQKTAQKL